MGFFFASKRSSGAPLSRGRVGDYDRVPPSTFRYIANTKSKHTVGYLVLSFFHLYVVSLYIAILRKVNTFVSSAITSTWIPVKVADMLPINTPDISVCFKKGVRITPEIETLLNKYDGSNSTRIISGKKSWQVNICRAVHSSDLPAFMGFAKYTDPTYSGSANTITPNQIEDFLQIVSVLSVAIRGVRNLFSAVEKTEGNPNAAWIDGTSRDTEKKVSVIDDVPLDIENSMVVDVDKKYLEGQIESDSVLVLWHVISTAAVQPGWGTIDRLTWKSGMALPFDRDISMPDRTGIQFLLEKCSRLFDKRTVDESSPTLNIILENLDTAWRSGIMSTLQGQWISHMVACLRLAMECHASLFVVISRGRYQGCMMGGGPYSILVKRDVYVQHTGSDFDLEKALIDSHRLNLDKVMKLLKMPAKTEQPKTLRSLRAMVKPGDFTGEEQNKVSELLTELSFGEQVEPINLSTMKNVLSLLSLDDPMVEKKVYMDPEAFWSTDKITIVLSMFGRRAPVFSSGQTLRRLTTLARGEGSSKVEKYSSTPPDVLQVTTKPLGTAVTTWKGLLSSGMAKGNWELEVQGNVVFRKGMKGELWNHLNVCLADAIKKDTSSNVSGTKRDADGDDDIEEGEIIPETKRVKKAFSYF